MPWTTSQIAEKIQGQVVGDPALVLSGFAPADKAKEGDLTFAENETYFRRADESKATAILVDSEFTGAHKTLIRVPNARVAFARVLPFFYPEPVPEPGRHSSAIMARDAEVHASAYIGPFCVIGPRVIVGPGCVLWGGNHLGEQSVLGERCQLFPNVVLYPRTQLGARVRIHAGSVIGSDGFGYVLDDGKHHKISQTGNVIVGEDVEIGAGVMVDRGALGPTIIGRGSKVDNLVQIAHNVIIGEHCLVVAQVGIAGSTKMGNHVTLGGQVGLAGHLKIGNGVTVAAQSGVMHDIPDGEKWLGSPARPDRKMKRQILALQHVPDLLRRISELEARVTALDSTPPSLSRAKSKLPD